MEETVDAYAIAENKIPAVEALGGFLANSGDEEQIALDSDDYDSGARIYETDDDTYDAYKDKVKDYYNKNPAR